MHIHILGIGGTFMGGLALLAKELNLKVSGADGPLYPPMSTQLESLNVELIQGYEAEQLNLKPDQIVVGNVMTRGMPVIEAILDQRIPMISGPEWLAQSILKDRYTLAVSGTHGKTTTSSMLAWILEFAGLEPGFLIGGIPINFGVSARLGKGKYFVVEADEYDSAFFDKRSKFIHYRPSTLIINNIEFDHADIFPNLEAIKTQFQHLIRTIPQSGRIIIPEGSAVIEDVLKRGLWSPISYFNCKENFSNPKAFGIRAEPLTPAGNHFAVHNKTQKLGEVSWELLGKHNLENAQSAILAAMEVGVEPEVALKALSQFKGVKRRLELKAHVSDVFVYDDFAHHPTAIQTTLEGLRAKLGEKAHIVAVVDIRSNTMKAGHHQAELAKSLDKASHVYFYKTDDVRFDLDKVFKGTAKRGGVFKEPTQLLEALRLEIKQSPHVIFMSNGGFAGIQGQFIAGLEQALVY